MFTLTICYDTKEKVYTYEEYLLTQHWRKFREAYIEEYGDKCRVCGARGADLHHLYYENLGNESFDEVLLLCRSCHVKEHWEEWNFE